MPHRRFPLAACLLAIAFAPSIPCPAETARAFSLGMGLCPSIGLDRAIRAATLQAFANIDLAAAIAPAFKPVRLGLEFQGSWDFGLGCALLAGQLGLGLGGGLDILLGYEVPLGSPRFGDAGIALEAAPCPNRFGLRARLFSWTMPDAAGGAAIGAAGSRGAAQLDLCAELGWTAWRLAPGAKLPAASTVTKGLSAFAAGFRATVALRLALGLPAGH